MQGKEAPKTTLGQAAQSVATDEMAKQMDTVETIIDNAKGTDEAKAEAKKALSDMLQEKQDKGEQISSIDELMDEVSAKMNTLKT